MNIDSLRQLVETVTARPGYSSAIGTRVLDVQAGIVSMALERRPEHEQAQGHFHGGIIAGLADHAAGAAVTTALPPGKFAVTASLTVNFLGPASGDMLVAKARARRVGGTIGFAEVEVICITAGEEELCATVSATMRAVDMPRPR